MVFAPPDGTANADYERRVQGLVGFMNRLFPSYVELAIPDSPPLSQEDAWRLQKLTAQLGLALQVLQPLLVQLGLELDVDCERKVIVTKPDRFGPRTVH